MKTIVIIQARMGSSRLPGKVLMPLGQHQVLDYVVNRSRKIKGVDEVIVATSNLPGDEAIVEWCKHHQVPFFQGSEEDVLARYYDCARKYEPDYIIRITSDCPFVDYLMASEVISLLKKQPSDAARIIGELPRGIISEMISFDTLTYIYSHGKEPRHREHVTYYAYEFSEKFQFAQYSAPTNLQHPQLRITLDTEEDYQLCKTIAGHFKGDMLVSTEEVIQFMLKNPEVAALNAHIEQKPVV